MAAAGKLNSIGNRLGHPSGHFSIYCDDLNSEDVRREELHRSLSLGASRSRQGTGPVREGDALDLHRNRHRHEPFLNWSRPDEWSSSESLQS